VAAASPAVGAITGGGRRAITGGALCAITGGARCAITGRGRRAITGRAATRWADPPSRRPSAWPRCPVVSRWSYPSGPAVTWPGRHPTRPSPGPAVTWPGCHLARLGAVPGLGLAVR
jgi:hypothetical protein